MTARNSTMKAADQEMSPARRWVALGALTFAVLLIAIDGTVLALALPRLAEDLKPSATEVLWIADAYSFVLAALLVTMGTLGDRVGRKKLLLIGAVGFGLASIPAAFAPTAGVLIAARAVLGLAGATLMPSTLSLVRNIFTDPKERSMAIGLWSATASAGMALGPLVGGVLLEHFWWGSVFLINLPVMLLLVIVGYKVLPESRDPNPGRWDMPSVALSMVGMVGTVYAIKELAAYGLAHPAPWIAGLVGVVTLLIFVRRQRRLAAPMVDVTLFANPRFSGAVMGNLLAIVGLAGVMFLLSQYLQLVKGLTPLVAGIQELPIVIGSIVAALGAGMLVARTSARLVNAGGILLIGLGLAAIVTVGIHTPYLPLGITMAVIGIGAGLSMTISADLILGSVPKERAGAASAISETAYELGNALGVALLGTVLNAIYRSTIVVPSGADPVVAGDSIAGAVTEAAKLPGAVAQGLISSAQHAFTDGLRTAAAAGAVLLIIAAVACWRMLRERPSADGPSAGAGLAERTEKLPTSGS